MGVSLKNLFISRFIYVVVRSETIDGHKKIQAYDAQ
jgi:hypothetical protein